MEENENIIEMQNMDGSTGKQSQFAEDEINSYLKPNDMLNRIPSKQGSSESRSDDDSVMRNISQEYRHLGIDIQ